MAPPREFLHRARDFCVEHRHRCAARQVSGATLRLAGSPLQFPVVSAHENRVARPRERHLGFGARGAQATSPPRAFLIDVVDDDQ